MEFELEIARNENLRKRFELKKLHLEKILSNKKTTLFSEMQSRSIIYNFYHLIRLIQLAKRSVTFFSIWLLDSLFPSTFFFGYRARCIASYAINCAQSKLSFRFFPLARDHFSSPGFVTRIYSASSWFASSFVSSSKTGEKDIVGNWE